MEYPSRESEVASNVLNDQILLAFALLSAGMFPLGGTLNIFRMVKVIKKRNNDWPKLLCFVANKLCILLPEKSQIDQLKDQT